MKHANGTKRQWLLCAALLMALGSQSYFQVSSNDFSSIELSSVGPPTQQESALEEKKLDDILTAASQKKSLKNAEAAFEANELERRKSEKDVSDDMKIYELYRRYEVSRNAEAASSKDTTIKSEKITQAKNFKAKADALAKKISAAQKKSTVVAMKAEPSKAVVAATAAVVAKTEGVAPLAEACEGGCNTAPDKTAVLDETVAAVMKIMKEKQAKEDKEVQVEVEVAVKETAKDKRERLAEAKKDAKEAKELAKKEKEDDKRAKKLEEKTERNERFAEKMEDVGEKCKENIECATTELSALLSRYTGDKKIDNAVVNKAFNKYVSKDLRAALGNRENTPEVADAIYQMTSEIPNEYRFLKVKAIDVVRNESVTRAAEINRDFQMASKLTKANKPLEAEQYWRSANTNANAFAHDYNVLRSSMTGGLESSQDRATLAYVNSDYVPNMQKLLTSLSNPSGVEIAKSEASVSKSASVTSDSSATSSSTRNARAGSQGALSTINKSNSSSSTVEIGSPTSSRRGSRLSN